MGKKKTPTAPVPGQQFDPGPVTRCFAMRLTSESYPTTVEVFEHQGGHIRIALVTQREGMEPFVTSMTLAPKTFTLLSEAMNRAATDLNVWRAPTT